MELDARLIAAANENFIGSFRKLCEHTGGEVARFGGAFAFASGLPSSFFNGCVVVEPTASADLEAAMAWVEARGEPFRVWVDEERAGDLRRATLSHGLVSDDEPFPGMVLHPVPEPPPPAPGVSVAAVTSATELEAHVSVRIASGMTEGFARRLISPGMAFDPDVRAFTGYLDERPVGGAVAFRTGLMGGVYAVATLAEARRMGVGAATTWACVSAARSWGLDAVFLQASEMGFPLYESMGFRTVISYAVYRQPAP